MNIKPLRDRIMIKPIKPYEGEVIAVGPGEYLYDGTFIKPTIKVGDRVIYGSYSGMKTTSGHG